MPYIIPKNRAALNPPVAAALTPGDLNYQMTVLAIRFVENHGLSYETLNAVVGVFESAKAEFQRRLVAPYEDQAKEHNGDIYPAF